jgi:WD40 repeat protein
MVDGALAGRNQTVLAYGQTGSGKTFTMGTGFDVDLSPHLEGVVPRAVKYLFSRIQALGKEVRGGIAPEVTVTVSFMELYRNTFYDLFDTSQGPGKHASNIKILDDRSEDGTTTVRITNIQQLKVDSVEELMERLRRGSMERVTKSTDMNATSSRSHAIFTLYVTHQRVQEIPGATSHMETPNPAATDGPASDSGQLVTTTAKFNFVDLAGSERLKRTGATGDRAKEGIDINSGLLALGNVISALGDVAKRGSHVPYRDSKLTRILQDSLGGNSKTVMIACISPCDRDFIETLNTLKYANRTRNIKNRVLINQDSASRQIQLLHETIAKLNHDLTMYRQGRGMASGVETEDARAEFEHLRDENERLKQKSKRLKCENESLKTQVTASQLAGRDPTEVVSVGAESLPLEEMIKNYVSVCAKLEAAEAMNRETKTSRPTTTMDAWRTRPHTSSDRLIDNSREAIQRGREALASASGGKRSDAATGGESADDNSDSGDDTDESGGADDGDAGEVDDEELEDEERGGNANASANTSFDDGSKEVLVEELGRQIAVQEQLLQELRVKGNELLRQRELYEGQLVSANREREKYALEVTQIKMKAASLSGNNGTEAKQLTKQYKMQVKELELKLKTMKGEARARDRDAEQQARIAQQMDTMKRNLDASKEQRRKLMVQAKEEKKKLSEKEKESNRKLAKLQKQSNQKAVKTKHLEDKFQKSKVQVVKLAAENEKLRLEQRRAKEMHRRQADNSLSPHTSPDRKRIVTREKVVDPDTRRSRRMSIVKARRKHVMLVQEVDRAVMLTAASAHIEDLIQRRDLLVAESKKLEAAKAQADEANCTQIDAELENCKTERELLTDAIEERQVELVSLDENGARPCTSVDDLSAESELIITSSTKRESHEMLKRLLCAMVRLEVNANSSQIQTKEIEIQLREKDAMLKSLIAGGVSKGDSPVRGKESPSRKGKADDSPSRQRSKTMDPPFARAKPKADLTITSEHGVFKDSLRGGGEKKTNPKRTTAVPERIVAERLPAKATSLMHTHTIFGHGDEVISAAVNGGILLTGSKDKTMRVWDVARSGTAIGKRLDHENKVTRVVHAGASFYSASRNVFRMWDAATLSCTEKITFKGDGDIRELVQSRTDPNHLFLTTDKTLRVLDMRQLREPLREIVHKGKIGCLEQLDETTLAIGSMNNVTIYPNIAEVASLSIEPPHNLSPPHYSSVISLARCGGHMFSGSKDFSIKRWDQDRNTRQWAQGHSLKDAHVAHVTALLGLPGDDALMGGSAKGVIRIWGAKALNLRTEGPAHTAAINQLICSGETVYSVSSDRTVKVWRYRPLRSTQQEEAAEEGEDVAHEVDESETTTFPFEGNPTETETTTFPFTSADAPAPAPVRPSLASTPIDRGARRLTYNLGGTPSPSKQPNLNTTFDLSTEGGAKMAWSAGADDLVND